MNLDNEGSCCQSHPYIQIGWTPLHESARNNNREVSELLIRHRANVNKCKDKVSTSPIPISDISPSHYNNYYILLST